MDVSGESRNRTAHPQPRKLLSSQALGLYARGASPEGGSQSERGPGLRGCDRWTQEQGLTLPRIWRTPRTSQDLTEPLRCELYRAPPDGRLALRSVAGIGSGDVTGLTSTGSLASQELETLRGFLGRGFMMESKCCNVVCRGLTFFFSPCGTELDEHGQSTWTKYASRRNRR